MVVADFLSIKPPMINRGMASQRYEVVGNCPERVTDTTLYPNLTEPEKVKIPKKRMCVKTIGGDERVQIRMQ